MYVLHSPSLFLSSSFFSFLSCSASFPRSFFATVGTHRFYLSLPLALTLSQFGLSRILVSESGSTTRTDTGPLKWMVRVQFLFCFSPFFLLTLTPLDTHRHP